mmetsp:Transcript_107218/g.130823  ORF Transcript_107218/g.130823 Transcript_107218/m.130823 type:complete len:228 (-) Transcript_107218:83-766(-)
MKSKRASLKEDVADLYDDFAIGWNELFEEPDALSSRRPTETDGIAREPIAPMPPMAPAKGRGKKVFVPPYLRIGGKRSQLDRAMKERLLAVGGRRNSGGEEANDTQSGQDTHGSGKKSKPLQPFPRLRKPAEVVEAELDQLRVQLQKELRERRRDGRRRRQMRRRCRLQEGEDLAELEAQFKLERLELSSPRSDGSKLSARSFFSQLGQKRLQDSAPSAPHAPLTAR